MPYYQPGCKPSWRKLLMEWAFITCVFEAYVVYSLWAADMPWQTASEEAAPGYWWLLIMPAAALPLALLLNFFHSGSDDMGCD
jgi:hypothetical protein